MKLFGRYGPEDLGRFSVREIKYARARLGVLEKFVHALQDTACADIRIRDLSRACEISEPSFYNYFPKKDDLFLYFISLWSVDIQLHTERFEPGVEAIYEIFRYTASSAKQNPNLLKEIIAYQSRTSPAMEALGMTPVSPAEKHIAFGSAPGLEQYPDQGLGPVLQNHLKEALRKGELPRGASLDVLTLALGSVFFGVPVLVIHQNPARLTDSYNKVLQSILPLKKDRKRR